MRLAYLLGVVALGCGGRTGLDTLPGSPPAFDAGADAGTDVAPDADPCAVIVPTYDDCTSGPPLALTECQREYAAADVTTRADVDALLHCIAGAADGGCRFLRRLHGICQGPQGALAVDVSRDPGLRALRCLEAAYGADPQTCQLNDGTRYTCSGGATTGACCTQRAGVVGCFFGSF